MLVNFDPVFRRTMYYVDENIDYRKVEILTGDDQMIPEFLKLSGINDLFARFNELKRSPEYVQEKTAETAEAPKEPEAAAAVTVEKAPEATAETPAVDAECDVAPVVSKPVDDIGVKPAVDAKTESITVTEPVAEKPAVDVKDAPAAVTDVQDDKPSPVPVEPQVKAAPVTREEVGQ